MEQHHFDIVNHATPRLESMDKALGRGKYTDDLELPNMACAALVRCPYSHAKVLSIDVSEAEKVPGFLGCALPEEAPQAYFNCSGNPPSPLLMADEKVLTTEPLTIGEHSTSRAGVCEDDVVFILGTGTIGTIIAQACKLKGAKTVICCDISDSSLERSKQFGADYTVNSKTQDIVAEVQKITNGHGRGAELLMDAEACFPGSLTMIMQPGIVCNAGRVVPMGFCTVPEKITQQMINGRELTICGTRMSLNQWVPTAQKMAEGKYHMEGLATTFVKFSEIEKVFDNIVHPDPAVKKTVILFDGAED